MKLSTIFNIVFAVITAGEAALTVGASIHYLETQQVAWLYCALLLLAYCLLSLSVFLFHEQLMCWLCIMFYDDDLDDIKDDVDGGSIIDWKPNEC